MSSAADRMGGSSAKPAKNRILNLMLALCAGCTWLVASIVMLEWLEPRGAWSSGMLCLTALIFAPLYTGHLLARIPDLRYLAPFLVMCLWSAQVLPIFLLPVPLGMGVPAGLAILMQGHLLMHGDEDSRAVAAIVIGPLYALFALEQTASLALLLLLPISITLGIGALICLHARVSLHRIERRRRVTIAGEQPRKGQARRLLFAMPLTLLIAAICLPLFRGLDALTSARDGRGAGTSQGAEGGEESADEDPAMKVAGGASTLRRDNIEEGLGFTGGAFPFGDAVVMKVRPLDEEQQGPGTLLHLRDIVHDYFTKEKIKLQAPRAPTTYKDAEDGREDGWTELSEPRAGDPVRRLEISTHPAIISEPGWTVLFAPQPALAFSLPAVLYDEDSYCVSPREEPDPLNYEILYQEIPATAERLAGKAARHPDERYLQLPEADAALAVVTARARRVTASSTSDFERVRAVLEHFRAEFEYALEDIGLPGTRAIAAFLEQRRGYCTYFASAAVMMLRSRGVASRVASGFMAYEWSEAEGVLLVRERNAHAWIEVYFENVGWVTFDPTPPRSREALYEAMDRGESGLQRSWYESLLVGVDNWLDDGSGLEAIAQSLIEAPLSLLLSIRGGWALLCAALLFGLHMLFRGKDVREPAALVRGHAAPKGLQRNLRDALASLGFRRGAGSTPREFARKVAQEVGSDMQSLAPITETFYRARFGERGLDESERASVQRLLHTIEELRCAQSGPDAT